MDCERMDTSSAKPCDDVVDEGHWERLPQLLIDEIINLLGDLRDIWSVQQVCRSWRNAGHNVRSLRVVVSDEHHAWARRNSPGWSSKSEPSTSESNILGSFQGRPGGRQGRPFKEQLVDIMSKKPYIEQLRFEVETKLQSKTVSEDERRRTDFWLADPWFLRQLMPGMGATLQHLCMVDYGQQAIMRRSSIIKILSVSCKNLKTLDLRNMFIDTSDCEEMKSMTSLTLRCVKVVGESLQHIHDKMPVLKIFVLLGVFGAQGGVLTFQHLKVLCLGLSTPVKDVVMTLPVLEKLQLKMQCPQNLVIDAPVLKYAALNSELSENSNMVVKSSVGLEELLFGATDFNPLSNLVLKNVQHLKKLFADIPCMALGEDGRFLGVLKNVSLQLPRFSDLHQCEKLNVLNIGPGLWHSMETQVPAMMSFDRLPSVQTLILHMIPHDMDSAMTILLQLLRPSVTSLTVFIHTSSPVNEELLKSRIDEIARRRNILPKILPWTKSLDFTCFSF